MKTYQEAVVRLRMKYLNKVLYKFANNEKLNDKEQAFFNKYCQVHRE